MITRTPIATGDPVTDTEFTEHMRLDADLVTGAYPYVRAAAREVEQYADIALLTQTITVTTNAHEREDGLTILRLPIGPAHEDVTVERVETDGTFTPMPYSYIVYNGAVRFAMHPEHPVRITYTAGYGETAESIPADLRMAVCDLAARLYDHRASDKSPAMPAATARICARYRRVML